MLVGICVCQPRPARKDDSPLIDLRKPSVYLSFRKSDKLTSKYGGDIDVVWLEIRNNTRWSIWSAGSPDEFGGSGWCYTRATDDGCRTPIYPLHGNCGDVIGEAAAAPGQTARIAVPAKDLSPGLAIQIAFDYEWEHAAGVRHTAFFGHSNLPEAVRSALPFDYSISRSNSACTDLRTGPDPPAVGMPAIPAGSPIETIMPLVPKPPSPLTQPIKKKN